MRPRVNIIPNELAANAPQLLAGLLLLANWHNIVAKLHPLPVLLMSNGSMVRYLKQSLTSKTMEPLQVYSDSAWTDVVLLFCFFLSPVTNHHKLDAHNKPQPILLTVLMLATQLLSWNYPTCAKCTIDIRFANVRSQIIGCCCFIDHKT